MLPGRLGLLQLLVWVAVAAPVFWFWPVPELDSQGVWNHDADVHGFERSVGESPGKTLMPVDADGNFITDYDPDNDDRDVDFVEVDYEPMTSGWDLSCGCYRWDAGLGGGILGLLVALGFGRVIGRRSAGPGAGEGQSA